MLSNDNSVLEAAEILVARHGKRARQKVVDEIVRAIKDHDMATAKHWDAIGEAVDERLAA